MPVILTLHGAGSNAAIFEVQSQKLRNQLPEDLEFVFFDAPKPSRPGPGMLPHFADDGPFYTWFAEDDRVRMQEVAALEKRIKAMVQAVQAGELPHIKGRSIDGIMAFSQGAVVAAYLLLQQMQGLAEWLPPLHFGIFICSAYTDDMGDYIDRSAAEAGKSLGQFKITLPSVHLHGSVDPFTRKSLKMMARLFDNSTSRLLMFRASHTCPTAKSDCESASLLIQKIL